MSWKWITWPEGWCHLRCWIQSQLNPVIPPCYPIHRRGLEGTAELYQVFDSFVQLDPVAGKLPLDIEQLDIGGSLHHQQQLRRIKLEQKSLVSSEAHSLHNESRGFVLHVERAGFIHVGEKAACAEEQVHSSSPGQRGQLPVDLLTAHQVLRAASESPLASSCLPSARLTPLERARLKWIIPSCAR